MSVSPGRRREIIDALRRGTVPQQGLDLLAVGLERFAPALNQEIQAVASGGASFKAVRGEYGAGKTFFARWLEERAKAMGFAASEVQISEAETPLHRLETVYRRLVERLSTADARSGALRVVVDRWLYALEEDVIATGVDERDTALLADRVDELMESRLRRVTDSSPSFGAALRAYRRAVAAGDGALADGVLAWVGGQPNVAAQVKRTAGLRGEIDHFGALGNLQGLLTILRDAGHPGLLLALDELETLQRVRSDVREKALNALRQLIDEVDGGRFPGLMLLITGTPAFFDGPQGVQRLAPLAQRLHVDFGPDDRFDNPRAVQIRLAPFDQARLVEVGVRVRGIYVVGCAAADRVLALCDDAYLEALASGVGGELGGRFGVAPRLFLRKLVGDVLDRIDQFPDFDPRRDYALTVSDTELTLEEREARRSVTSPGRAARADDISLDLP
jgi:hypothetical protein